MCVRNLVQNAAVHRLVRGTGAQAAPLPRGGRGSFRALHTSTVPQVQPLRVPGLRKTEREPRTVTTTPDAPAVKGPSSRPVRCAHPAPAPCTNGYQCRVPDLGGLGARRRSTTGYNDGVYSDVLHARVKPSASLSDK